MLNKVIQDGPADATPLLIAHGLFGSARNWGAIAKRVSKSRKVIAVDMRNHGESGWTDTHSYSDMAQDLAEIIDEPMDVLGHSMGGKAAMMLALRHPEQVSKLVVADIAPVAYSHTQASMIDAMRAIDLSLIETRGDADRQMQANVSEAGVRAFLLQSLDVKGRKWRLNLNVLEAEMEKIKGFPDETGRFDGPALFLSGADSDYVQRAHQDRIRELFPASRFAKIPDAGHWLHAENPRAFEAALVAFLDA